jgi:hypothetical protein
MPFWLFVIPTLGAREAWEELKKRKKGATQGDLLQREKYLFKGQESLEKSLFRKYFGK